MCSNILFISERTTYFLYLSSWLLSHGNIKYRVLKDNLDFDLIFHNSDTCMWISINSRTHIYYEIYNFIFNFQYRYSKHIWLRHLKCCQKIIITLYHSNMQRYRRKLCFTFVTTHLSLRLSYEIVYQKSPNKFYLESMLHKIRRGIVRDMYVMHILRTLGYYLQS